MALMEVAEQRDQMFCVVIGACHQVAASHVEPFHLRQPLAVLRLECLEHLRQVVARRLAEGMEMQALESFRKSVGQVLAHLSEAAPRHAWIVDVGLYYAASRVYPKPGRNLLLRMLAVVGLHPWMEFPELGQGVEGDVAASLQKLAECVFGIDRAIGVHLVAEMLQ